MKTLSTNQFILEQIDNNLFNVYRNHYDINLTTSYGQVYLHDDVILGLEKKPQSGYWHEVVRQCVEGYGKLYEKFKIN